MLTKGKENEVQRLIKKINRMLKEGYVEKMRVEGTSRGRSP